MGPAVFSLPDPGEARTTSWAQSPGQFCVFTGYLFNLDELASELECKDGTSQTPAAIVLEGYRKLGCDVANKLDGRYAWTLWDQDQQLLVCSKDPMGLHPLFYSQRNGELVVSWDLETVRSHPSIPRDLDPVVLAEHLNYRWMHQEETFFAAVRRLPGGHCLTWRDGALKTFRYWEPVPQASQIQWLRKDDLGEFPSLLQRSVRRTMQFGQTGILLSGGFDSVSIAAWAAEIAKDLGQGAPRAFCLVFPGTDGSEERIQREVAQHFDFPATFAYMRDFLKGRGLLGRVLDLSHTFPAPPALSFKPGYLHLLQEARAQGCQVVLSGEGGDEWLTVTPALSADLIRSGDLRGLLRLLVTGYRSWQLPKLALTRNVLWSYGVRELLRDWGWRRFPDLAMRRRRNLMTTAIPAWMAPDPALRRKLEERFELWERPADRDTFYLSALRADFRYHMTALAFEETFYRDLVAGVPTLTPYWDRPLMTFLLRTPPSLLNAGGRSKALVRRALAEKFPALGFQKQKKESAVKFSTGVYRTEGPRLWQELGPPQCLADLGVVDSRKFESFMKSCGEDGGILPSHRVWQGAATEAWVRAHL